jgi:hypothetical protein
MGVVLWEMLTANRLFWGETDLERIAVVTRGRIPPPSERQPTIPPELEEVTMKALHRDPERRYPTARAMSRDLERFLGHWGDSVPHADVADWLAVLFPGAAERKRQLLRQAFPAAPNDAPEATADPPADAVPPEARTELQPVLTPPTPGPSGPSASPRRRRPLIVGLLALAAISTSIGVWFGRLPAAGAPARDGPPPALERRSASAPPLPETTASSSPDEPPAPAPPPAPSGHPARRGRSAIPQRIERRLPAAAPATGQLLLRTTGGAADIFYKGRRLTRSPALLTLPAGQHELQVGNAGDPALLPITVSIKAGETVVYDVRLQRRD